MATTAAPNTRRLSSGWSLKTGVPASPTLKDENDDAREKQEIRERRKSFNKVHAALSSPLKSRPIEVLKEVQQNGTASAVGGVSKKPEARRRSLFAKKSHAGAALSNTQLAELYSSCMKMSMENKINAKNSWDLNLIDYIDDVLNEEGDDVETNFQRASVTLETASKIYGSRVDSLEADTYRVLGGLNRNTNKEEGQDGEDTTESSESAKAGKDSEDNKANVPGKEKRKVAPGSTLETSFAPLKAKKLDAAWEVDPIFSKTSAAFDEGGARGLLMNHLFVHTGCEVVFDSNDAVSTGVLPAHHSSSSTTATAVSSSSSSSASSPPPTSHAAANSAYASSYPLAALRAVFPSMAQLQSLSICPQFGAFVASAWADDSDSCSGPMKGGPSATSSAPYAPSSSATSSTFDGDADDSFGGDNDFGSGLSELDADVVFGTGLQSAAAVALEEEKLRQGLYALAATEQGENGAGEVFLANASGAEFFAWNPAALRSWAGPDHWKFAKVKAGGSGATEESSAKSGGKRTKKAIANIDFGGPAPDPTVAFATSKAATTLSASTLAKPGSFTLPKDVKYTPDNLMSLFLRPTFRVQMRVGKTTFGNSATENLRQWYDYNNANDDENFVPALPPTRSTSTADRDYDDDDFGGGAEDDHENDWSHESASTATNSTSAATEVGTGLSASVGGLVMVAEPQKVNKIEINYAREAKKVNVMALKESLWGQLRESSASAPGAASTAATSQALKNKMAAGGETSLQAVLSALPAKLDDTLSSTVSVPFVFICLLHLANEKCLKIEGRPGLDDLIIQQDGGGKAPAK